MAMDEHLAHHRDTNNPDIDPDHWVAVENPFLVLFRCSTIVFWYHQYFWKHIAFHAHIPGMRPLTIHIAAMYAVLYSVALGLSVLGWWREVLMLWIVPHFIASAMIDPIWRSLFALIVPTCAIMSPFTSL